MRSSVTPGWRRRRSWWLALATLLACAVAALAWWGFGAHGDSRGGAELSGTVHGAHGVQLASRLYVPTGVDARHPAPAVLLGHGLGGTLDDVEDLARAISSEGYVVRTWTARGGRGSDGRVGIAAPDGEVADVTVLVDELAGRSDVLQDGIGDPRVGAVGISHGGGVSLLAAERDHRIDSVVPIFAWSSLLEALEPNAARALDGGPAASHGVLAVRWASTLFAVGADTRPRAAPCGNLEHELCDAWAGSVAAGTFTPRARQLIALRDPAQQAQRLRAPTLFVQGQNDSLFGLDQATVLAAELRRSGHQARLEWVRAGHDAGLGRRGIDHLRATIGRWLDDTLRREDVRARDVPASTVELGAGRGFAASGTLPARTVDRAVVLRPDDAEDDADRLRYATPPGGLPAATTTLPGLGDVTGLGAGALATPEGQRVRFVGAATDTGIEIVGAPTVQLRVAGTGPSATLFGHLVDIAPGGQELVPRGLVAAARVDHVPGFDDASGGRTIELRLPAIAWRVAPGHRLELEIASTDAGFLSDTAPAVWGVGLAGDGALHLPEAGHLRRVGSGASGSGRGWIWRLVAGALLLATGLVAAWVLARRSGRAGGHVSAPQLEASSVPPVAQVPLVVRGLSKRYRDGRLAVHDVDLVVEPGAVVGLVGPNGAGKTTLLRVVLGLLRPTAGEALLFGERVRPGVRQLGRVGALVDGPGLVPHLTVREHLAGWARAGGRDVSVADVEAALDSVGLGGADGERRVSTCSQGMRQRLGIAQAVLGAPELVVLDEPANGLDPAQIGQLRDLIAGIAASGRSALVSSHLLAELERMCTHVVLLAEGGVLASGRLDDVVGAHGDLEAAYLAHVDAARSPRGDAPDA